MEIEIKELPITIKTIEINGKKLTKQFLQQIPLYDLYFLKDNNYYTYKELLIKSDEDLSNYKFDSQPIGYINVLLDKDNTIKHFFQKPNINIYSLLSFIFIDSDGELCRSYVHKSKGDILFGDALPQIFI